MKTIRIRQPNRKGYAEMLLGGVVDLNYASSTTRRGRVQGDGNICPTICAENPELCRVEDKGDLDMETEYRIRKLTPQECFRLMNFKNEDFKSAESVNSNSQLYKEAGNSIVTNVLVAIMGQMIPGKEDVYKDILNDDPKIF